MQSPSPPPSPLSRASLFQQTSSNELQNHMTHQGSAAAWKNEEKKKNPPLPLKSLQPEVAANHGSHHVTLFVSRDYNINGVQVEDASGDGINNYIHRLGSIDFVSGQNPLPAIQGEELQSQDGHHQSGSITLDHGASPNQTASWPQLNQSEWFSMIGTTDQSQLSLGDNRLEEETLAQDIVGNDLSVPETLDTPDYGSFTWSLQQPAINTAAGQNFMGYNNPYLAPPQAMLPSPPLLGPSLYPPPPFSVLQRTPCHLCPQTFARHSDLSRHYASVHLGIKHHCFYPGCANNRGLGYCRLEKLRTHQREKHGVAWS